MPQISAFARYWTAATVSSFGTAVTAVAMPVLVVTVLHATPAEVGMVSAAQFLPYALLGLLVGVYVDRRRRRPILVWASLGRAVALAIIPLLWLCGVLDVGMVVGALLAFGGFSVFGFAASQSFLPALVPRERLLSANARLDQTDATAQTLGPAIGGGLVAVLGAPVALAVDAASYLADAVLAAGIRVDEPRSDSGPRRIGPEIREGLRSTYRHPVLGSLAVSTHVWFLGQGAAMTVLPLLALRHLGLGAVGYGALLTVLGIATFVGSSLAPRLGSRLQSGRVIVLARGIYPIGWILALLAAVSPGGVVLLIVALALQGLAMGAENSHEQVLWQSLTPDRVLGRTNATRRSINRTAAAGGALVGGVLVGATNDVVVLAGVILVFAAALLIGALSPLARPARR